MDARSCWAWENSNRSIAIRRPSGHECIASPVCWGKWSKKYSKICGFIGVSRVLKQALRRFARANRIPVVYSPLIPPLQKMGRRESGEALNVFERTENASDGFWEMSLAKSTGKHLRKARQNMRLLTAVSAVTRRASAKCARPIRWSGPSWTASSSSNTPRARMNFGRRMSPATR